MKESLPDVTAEAFQRAAYSRNIGLFSVAEQQRLRRAVVAIPGMGGVGGSHLLTAVRAGFGNFRLADFDSFDAVNINRQQGAKTSTFGRPKLEVMAAEALDINPHLDIRRFPEGVTEANMAEFLGGADVLLDGLDFFAVDLRRRLFNTALAMGVPVITAGPLGFSAALLVFSPKGPNYDAYFGYDPDWSELDKLLHFLLGLTPRFLHGPYMDPAAINLARRVGPSSIMACELCSASAVMQAVKIVLERPGVRFVPAFQQIDLYRQTWATGRLPLGNRGPLQRLKLHVAKNRLVFARRRVPPRQAPLVLLESGGLTREALLQLVDAASQAPSGDNCQPWKFSAQGATLHLDADLTADDSFFNVRQTATVISAGAALENLQLYAASLGLRATTQPLPDPQLPGRMASVAFAPAIPVSPDDEPLATVIWQRCTNRKPFTKKPLPGDVAERLRQAAADVPGVHLHLLAGRPALAEAAQLVFLADRIRAERRDLHEYFMSMVRFTPEAVLETLDGMPLKNLEAGFGGELFLKATRSWRVMGRLKALGFGRVIAQVARSGILSSGAVGLVTTDGFDTAHFLRGGQGLERVWLRATAEGLEFQPMTAITLFWLRWLWEGPQAFAPEHQASLQDVWPRLQALFPAVDLHNHAPVMLFRLGYGPAQVCGTYRRLPETLIDEV